MESKRLIQKYYFSNDSRPFEWRRNYITTSEPIYANKLLLLFASINIDRNQNFEKLLFPI
jgi:hypothetical protein